MKQVYKVDVNGFYIEPVIVENELPQDCIVVRPQDGFFKAKWDGEKWIEGLSQTEIDAIKNTPVPLTELEQLKKQQELMQQALDDLIFGGA